MCQWGGRGKKEEKKRDSQRETKRARDRERERERDKQRAARPDRQTDAEAETGTKREANRDSSLKEVPKGHMFVCTETNGKSEKTLQPRSQASRRH